MQARGHHAVELPISMRSDLRSRDETDSDRLSSDYFGLSGSALSPWSMFSSFSQPVFLTSSFSSALPGTKLSASSMGGKASVAPAFNSEIAEHAKGFVEITPGSQAPGVLVSRVDMNESFARGGGSTGGGGGGGKATKVLTDYYSGSADGTAGYDIWIQFSGTGWTSTLQKAFIDAADYLTKVITADIGGGGTINGKRVDDLYVSAEMKSIDGVGGILGQAGVTNVWTSNELSASGMMQFDSADATNYLGMGLWDDIVTHELMHVVGFGSLWNYGTNPLVVTPGQYTGSSALAAYNQATNSSSTFIPLETSGGSGTAGVHWAESSLGNELMTGYINNSNYLSKFSVMSLADLGYSVAYQDYPHDNVFIA